MNATNFKKAVKNMCEAIDIVSDHSFRVYGEEVHVAYQQPYMSWNQPLQYFGQNQGDEDQMKINFSQHLAGTIYNLFYCSGKVSESCKTRLHQKEQFPSKEERDQYISVLSANNMTQDGYDPYWTVYSLGSNGTAFVMKNGMVRQLMPATYEVVNQSDTTLRQNSMVHIRIVKENITVQPAFYHVFSDELVSQQAQLCRIYFHLKPEGSPVLVKEITTMFNKYKIPFSFKCLNHPMLYTRADSAVLYLDKVYSRVGFSLLNKIVERIKSHLVREVPLFSKKLYNGVSFAEDPGASQSFGMNRSSVIAQGLHSAYEKGLTDTDKKAAEVLRIVQKNGLDQTQFYLRPNSKFPYEFSILN